MKKLLHWSVNPLEKVENREQAPLVEPRFEYFRKPKGLWVSVGDGKDSWRAWCESEEFGLRRLANCTQVIPAEDAKLLWITTLDEIDAFAEKYGVKAEFAPSIDWLAVAYDYQGVLIAPYFYERRLEPSYSWYYGWDCASGCIWDANAVAKLVPVKKKVAA
jgi:hypothetical protein